MTERLADRVEQLESRVERVENRMTGLATSAQISELRASLDTVGSQINARIDSLDNQINVRIEGLDNRINARLSVMDVRLNDITRVGIGIIIALLLSVVGLIVAGITQ